MVTYKLFAYNGQNVSVTKFINNEFTLSIPFAPDNTDYQAYLKWVSEGGVPLPADE
jgi:hypothetical protein